MGGMPQRASYLYSSMGSSALAVGAREEAWSLYVRAHILSDDPDLTRSVGQHLRVLHRERRVEAREAAPPA
jgi:hypothetical protein